MIDKRLRPECLTEMNEVRQSLMSDYRINPEIIANCEAEIKICQPDNDDRLEEGAVVHCLMKMANTKRKPNEALPMSAPCRRAVSMHFVREHSTKFCRVYCIRIV